MLMFILLAPTFILAEAAIVKLFKNLKSWFKI